MHLTTEAGDPVAPVLFEEDSLGLSPTIVLPEPLPEASWCPGELIYEPMRPGPTKIPNTEGKSRAIGAHESPPFGEQ